jgi:hypothetical protein
MTGRLVLRASANSIPFEVHEADRALSEIALAGHFLGNLNDFRRTGQIGPSKHLTRAAAIGIVRALADIHGKELKIRKPVRAIKTGE